MSGIEFDLSDIRAACDRGDLELELGARRVAETSAKDGLDEALRTHRYQNRTYVLSGTARTEIVKYDRHSAEADIVWQAPYASYVERSSKGGFAGTAYQKAERSAEAQCGTLGEQIERAMNHGLRAR